MKLIKLTDEVYINPSLVTSVVIDNDISDKKTGEARYCVVVSCGEDQIGIAYRLPKQEASAMLDWIAVRINHALEGHDA